MKCSQCSHINDPDAVFCERCGSPLARICAACGATLKAEARFCNQCGARVGDDRLAAMQEAASPDLKSKMRAASQQVEGERKPVTILFTDIVGSTALAEKLDPEEWKEIVSGAHQRVSQAVYRYEGTVAQLLGDGVLAFFGAPITHEDDPLRAVLAALDIQASMREYERQLQGYVERFQLRVGLNTGTVVVGSVGSDLHLEYLAIGDAVNLAARLQSAAQPGCVLISENTARLVRAACELEPLGEISLKGKAEPVAVYEVKAARAMAEGRRGYEELRSPLVGREAELAALREAFQSLSAGLGQIVSISGEAGIGKSRLVQEACQAWGAEQPTEFQEARWLEGRALSYGQKLSFWTIQQLIQSDLGLSDGDPELKMRLALRKRVEALFGNAGEQVLPYLATLLGVQLEQEQTERLRLLDGETLKHQTLLSITGYFSRLAEIQRTVLVFDDLHWADPSSLEALERLLPVTDHAPLMILLLSRLEREHASWRVRLKAQSEYAHRFTDIALNPLSFDEQNRLVDNLLVVAELPQTMRERILERAEGNPLFLEEIMRDLVERGSIVRQGEAWRMSGDIRTIVIPETLRGVLLARIDRLQEDVRRTLQLAAVIGKSFQYNLLEAIAKAEEQLEGHLSLLQRLDLVREKRRLPELEYMFRHSLTQEAAYNSLLLEQRSEFHRRVGLALEELFADRKDEFIGLLAYHFDAAGAREKAITYLVQAGDKARLSDEHMEAVGYYQRAIEISGESGNQQMAAQVWLKLGLVYHANFQFEETYQAYENAFILKAKNVSQAPEILPGAGQTLRIYDYLHTGDRYDPGKAYLSTEGAVILQLFSGLAKVDNELNVVPDVARSWQVLDGGRRYLFHLRDDVRWTDGTPVTAYDFEWAWKRNLHPSIELYNALFLFSVSGAQEYYLEHNPDPDSIGVRALDTVTFEVRLVEPVAYFPYVTTMPFSFPLPRQVIERIGDDWWRPENIVCNGAYRLVEFDAETGGAIERNPGYHGGFTGNVHRVEWKGSSDPVDRQRAYLENQVDVTNVLKYALSQDLAPQEIHNFPQLVLNYILVNPMIPPFNDLRLRQALCLALDRDDLFSQLAIPPVRGGILPPGMVGHTPFLAPAYDPDAARRLMVEAGFPKGAGLPEVTANTFRGGEIFLQAIIDQWYRVLGIRAKVEFRLLKGIVPENCSVVLLGWAADYPDPDNFLQQSSIIVNLERRGWRDKAYDVLVGEAMTSSDRKRRMALYRQADRYLVAEQALVIPLDYTGGGEVFLLKPWVKRYHPNPLGWVRYQDVVVEEHSE